MEREVNRGRGGGRYGGRLGIRIGTGDWDWGLGLGLGIGIGDWDWDSPYSVIAAMFYTYYRYHLYIRRYGSSYFHLYLIQLSALYLLHIIKRKGLVGIT